MGEGDGDGAGFGGPPAYAVAGNAITVAADTIDTACIAVSFMALLAFCWDSCPLVRHGLHGTGDAGEIYCGGQLLLV